MEVSAAAHVRPKPRLGFWDIWNMSFGFLGIQFGFALQNSNVSIVPYVQPTGFLTIDGGSDFLFGLGLGADFRLTPRFDARISAGLGDIEGVSIGAVWVH